MILSVGWPLSRQLVLSFEAILECTAPFIENRRQCADYTAHKNKPGTTRGRGDQGNPAGSTVLVYFGPGDVFRENKESCGPGEAGTHPAGAPRHRCRLGSCRVGAAGRHEGDAALPLLSGAAETLSVQTLPPPPGNQAPHRPLPGLPLLAQRPSLVTWLSGLHGGPGLWEVD